MPLTPTDLRGKIQNLIQVASETSQYLASIISNLEEISRSRIEAENKHKSLTTENESLKISVESLRKRIDQEYVDHSERMNQEKAAVQTLKSATIRDREQAAAILNDLNGKQADFNAQKEAFETKRRDIEARFAKAREAMVP